MSVRYLTARIAQQVRVPSPYSCYEFLTSSKIDEELMGSVGAFSIDQVSSERPIHWLVD